MAQSDKKKKRPSSSYLESFMSMAKELLPGWLFDQVRQAAIPVSGGKARWSVEKQEGFPTNKKGWTAAESVDEFSKKSSQFSKQEANYQVPADSADSVCGRCRFFVRDSSPFVSSGQCQLVSGRVDWFGTSDLFIDSGQEAQAIFDKADEMEEQLGSQGSQEAAIDYSYSVHDILSARRALQKSSHEEDDEDDDKEELVQKKIVLREGKYCVLSQDGSRSFGCFKTKEEAQKRLAQVEGFKRKEGSDMSDEVEKVYEFDIAKADDEKMQVFGVVLEPDSVDTQGDTISAEEIERAAHRFLVKSRVIGKQHKQKAEADVIESAIARSPFKLGDQEVKAGSWVIGVQVNDQALWEGIKSGEFTGFSVGGRAIRRAVDADGEGGGDDS